MRRRNLNRLAMLPPLESSPFMSNEAWMSRSGEQVNTADEEIGFCHARLEFSKSLRAWAARS